jgi:hypothetical protein
VAKQRGIDYAIYDGDCEALILELSRLLDTHLHDELSSFGLLNVPIGPSIRIKTCRHIIGVSICILIMQEKISTWIINTGAICFYLFPPPPSLLRAQILEAIYYEKNYQSKYSIEYFKCNLNYFNETINVN